jgi:hypothetical protein
MDGYGQQQERSAADKAGSEGRAVGLCPSVSSVSLCFIASPLQYSTPHSIRHKILCNLFHLFPLYGVEAGGLLAKAVWRKEANMDKARR